MIWREGAGNEMKKGSEQKGIQPGECGRIRDKSCCSWGCATEATKRRFPFLLLQSVLPEEMDGPRFLVALATPSQYSCNKKKNQKPEKNVANSLGSWEDNICYLLSLQTLRGTSQVPSVLCGSGGRFLPAALPSLGASPRSICRLLHPFSSLIFVSAALNVITWVLIGVIT